jgi:hypothetical protein
LRRLRIFRRFGRYDYCDCDSHDRSLEERKRPYKGIREIQRRGRFILYLKRARSGVPIDVYCARIVYSSRI